MFAGTNCIVLDLETAQSADDCFVCGQPQSSHIEWTPTRDVMHRFEAIGWKRKAALGLSIGAWYDYRDGRMHWFDRSMLEDTVALLTLRRPLMVSFNGIGFDFGLMRAVLRDEALRTHRPELDTLCDAFKVFASTSYDILAEIWAADPANKYSKGLNSLDAILKANGFPPKTGHGAEAPRQWQNGQYARVLNYCQNDVLATKALFEHIAETQGIVQRRDGPLAIRYVAVQEDTAVSQCLTPLCLVKHVVAWGLCDACYTVTGQRVTRGETTWERLVEEGKAFPAHGVLQEKKLAITGARNDPTKMPGANV